MSAANSKITELITRIRNVGGNSVDLASRMASVLMSCAKSPGFWNGEVIPPHNNLNREWSVVQRFHSEELARNWMQSDERKELFSTISPPLCTDNLILSDEISTSQTFGEVATAIVTTVKPGMEDDYWQWEHRIKSALINFPGYCGVSFQPPEPGKPGEWITIIRFTRPEDLDAWLSSPVRKSLLVEGSQFIATTRVHKLSSSFPGWFPINESTGTLPPKWKTAALVLVGLYPVIMVLKRFFLPLLSGMNLAIANAVNTICSVTIVTWISMPILVKSFQWWLVAETSDRHRTVKGLLSVACVLALEIALLWNLFPRA